MELTAKTLHEVTFGAKVRGYDPAEVDEFIAAVAEGVEELHERLRRATERAVRAEQQSANAATAAAPSAVAPPPGGGAEISKVWERAAFAAEAAVEEAKQEAQRLLDDAHERSEQQLAEARQEAGSAVRNAQEEAARIANEAQGQLRAEISQLEQAREQLQRDVRQLSGFVDGELGRVRETLADAMAALDQHATGASPAPEVGEVQTPPERPVSDSRSSWGGEQPSSSWDEPSRGSRENVNGSSNGVWGDQAADDVQSMSFDEGEPEWGSHPDMTSRREPEPSPERKQRPPERAQSQSMADEGDPFLAELRRAVQDEGPLGPRDEGRTDEETSIDRLYANDEDEDDKSGFFRRKK